ncbi:MAG: YqhA family protein [Actinobacteria bacterium]|nr:MAG: YqhA family protein [Actinomycetota bacterium]
MDETRPATPAKGGLGLKVTGWTRYIVAVPVVGLFASAVALVLMGGARTVAVITESLHGAVSQKATVVEFIEVADVFLLATVLYIISLGLFELFIDDRLPLPAWLEIHDLDDLKEKLVGVVVVVLGVSFLGRTIEVDSYLNLLYLGLSVAAVIGALTFFLGRIGRGKGE